MEAMEIELQQFFEHCRTQQLSIEQMRTVCQPLIWHFRLAKVKRWILWSMLVLLLYLLWLYCDSFAWSVSAVGRLLLLQLLPYWDWTPYYNTKCLIERGAEQVEPSPIGWRETSWENCALCETLEDIPTAENVSYAMIESQYLERGLPVIVTDAQLGQTLDELLQLIQLKTPEMLTSEPCDMSSSLLLRKLFNVDAALQKIHSLPNTAGWHLQMRNCQPRAVKSSRLYVQRPYYYPFHMEPYYSSWLLMANNIRRPLVSIVVRGLVFVQQLSGHFDLRLEPKPPCDDGSCPSLSMRLLAGEGLVFSTDLWRFSYGLHLPDPSNSSIATVLEIDWQL